MSSDLYPLLLQPVYKDYIWGGGRLKTDFGKQTDLSPLAESWELACHKDGINIIKNGAFKGWPLDKFLMAHPEALGESVKSAELPILVKLIDAHDNLSIQVHPNEEYAQRAEGERGKTEMWYILDCEPGASLIYGFSSNVTKEELRRRILDNSLLEVVNRVPVKKGDTFFIEAGTLHGIGKGIILAEIQQNSNVTYRVYDYGRVGSDRKPRLLHIDKAIDVVNLNRTEAPKHNTQVIKKEGYRETLLQTCEHFTTKLIEINGSAEIISSGQTFTHILCIGGSGTIEYTDLKLNISKGSSVFLTTGNYKYKINGQLKYIVSRP